MTHEQHLALDLIARLANRFGPASRIAKELPGWLEYLTEVECPERPRTRPSTQWWNKVRAIARDLVVYACAAVVAGVTDAATGRALRRETRRPGAPPQGRSA